MKSSLARRQPRKVGNDDDEAGNESGQPALDNRDQGTIHYQILTAKMSDVFVKSQADSLLRAE